MLFYDIIFMSARAIGSHQTNQWIKEKLRYFEFSNTFLWFLFFTRQSGAKNTKFPQILQIL